MKISKTLFIVLLLRVFLGKRFGNILKNKAILLGGIILLIIGLKILIEGLLK
ncbi:MAG TPA: manganese efflux pump [Bacilli bacterium]|nr:manganese efflux pump [Bacilli bacterium]HPN61095.1 manganese efflux pump [Bacilli bacterium]HPX83894.1 manganese efflux pump [Bacilli bacterium]HQC74752.1 manganese efflux pump [Bacilli bacterium]